LIKFKNEKKLSTNSFSQNERLVYKEIFGESMDANCQPVHDYKLSIVDTTKNEINHVNTSELEIDGDNKLNKSCLNRRKQYDQ